MDEDQARRALEKSIELARHHDSRYELALSLQAVRDLWPTEADADALAECDSLFGELGVLESARRILPAALPEARV